jgi:uncharacterized protein (DUF1015 family)
MRLIRPFRGVRPTKEMASKVAAFPYDVINRSEAKALAANNPYSFLHINKPEIDVSDDISPYDPIVYETGRINLDEFLNSCILSQDDEETFYVYKQKMGAHEQTGLVAVASVEAYEKGIIKKHEFTRPEKEDDRVNHMEALGAQVGPVFLTYKHDKQISDLINQAREDIPAYDFDADDGIRHTFWVIKDEALRDALNEAFNRIEAIYVADGHHRSAAACRVKQIYAERNKAHTGKESYNYFLAVLFPHTEIKILDYNRILKDLNGLNLDGFLNALQENFDLQKAVGGEQVKPNKANEFGLYTDGAWYKLNLKSQVASFLQTEDASERLDVAIMQKYILSPILNICDQRTDHRIDFVGGIRGLSELERRVDGGAYKAAMSLYPTSVESLMCVADSNQVMPPKSTWFEPKLKSGLITHLLD